MTLPHPEIRWLSRWSAPVLGLLAVLGVFTDLGGLVLRQWDEARLAVNALEMVQSGDYIVTTFDFEPDLWNTKPPLMIWLQALCIRLLGPTEWAVRLPAALAAFATLGLVYGFVAKFLRYPLGGLLAGTILISALGFLGEHHGHTGDYDALLTLAHMVTGLSLLLLLETKQPRWWFGIALGLTVATLTKGVAVLLPMPGVALYCLAHQRGRALLRTSGFWLVLMSWVAVTASWYVLREHQAPGYWAAVSYNELGGRFNTVLEFNEAPWYHYFARMGTAKFLPWIYVVPFAIPFALRHPNARARRVAWFALAWAASLLLLLSIAKTKLAWYSVPAYPWLAILAGLGAPRFGVWLLSHTTNQALRISLRVLFTAFIVVPPFITINHELRKNWRDTSDDVRIGYGLRALQHEPQPPTPLAVVALPGFEARRPITAGGKLGYNPSLRFHVLAYPRPAQVITSTDLASLRTGYVLTASAADSTIVRTAFPGASCRAVGRFTCWLWTLPLSP